MKTAKKKPLLLKGKSRKELLREMDTKGVSSLSHTSFISPEDRAPKVATYVRVSTQGQAELGNAEAQKGQVDRLFRQHFKEDKYLVGRFVDEAYNLDEYEPDRQLWQLLELVALGKVNTIICFSTNRVFRSKDAGIQGKIVQILNNRTATVIDQSKKIVFDPSNASNSLVTAVEAGLGVVDKSITVTKLQDNRRSRVKEANAYVPSIVPYGYDIEIDPLKKSTERDRKKLVPVLEELAIVEDIYRLYLGEEPKLLPAIEKNKNGKRVSDKLIAEHLNLHDFNRNAYISRMHRGLNATPHWTMSAITYILTNPIYKGELLVVFRETKEGGLYRAPADSKRFEVPGPITKEDWDRVQKIREKICEKHAQRFNTLHSDEEYWLHGKLICRVCQKTLKGRTSSNMVRYYRCEGKRRPGDPPHDYLRALDIEPLIEPFFRRYIDLALTPEFLNYRETAKKFLSDFNEDHARIFVEKRIENLKDRLASLRQESTKLYDRLERGVIDEELYVEKNKHLKESKKSTTEEIEKSEEELMSIKDRETKEDVSLRLEAAFKKAAARDSTRLKSLRTLVLAMTDKIEVEKLPTLNTNNLSLEQMRYHFMMGRLTTAHLKGLGWSVEKVHRLLGKSGRKKPLDWTLVMTLSSGAIKHFHPAPNYVPAAVLPSYVKKEERLSLTTPRSSKPLRLTTQATATSATATTAAGSDETNPRGRMESELQTPRLSTFARWGSRLPEGSISVLRVEDPRYIEAKDKFVQMRENLKKDHTSKEIQNAAEAVTSEKY